MRKQILIYTAVMLISLLPLGYLVSKHFIELYNLCVYIGIFIIGLPFIIKKRYFLGCCFYWSFVWGTYIEYICVSDGMRSNTAILMNAKTVVLFFALGIFGEMLISFTRKRISRKKKRKDSVKSTMKKLS